MSKLPALQFYPGDWKKDPGVQALSFHDRAIWFEMLLLMHESEQRGKLILNGKPIPHEALARLIGISPEGLTQSTTTLLEYGVSSVCSETGAIMSRRMVRDEELRQLARINGKLGGNPSLVKSGVNPPDKRKSRSSSSSSKKMKDCVSDKTQGDPEFSAFWNIYPKKADKKRAMKAWKVAVKDADPQSIIAGARLYAEIKRKDPQFIKNAATWLNDGSWENEYQPPPKKLTAIQQASLLWKQLQAGEITEKEYNDAGARIHAEEEGK